MTWFRNPSSLWWLFWSHSSHQIFYLSLVPGPEQNTVRVDAHTITACLVNKDYVKRQRARAKRLHRKGKPSSRWIPSLSVQKYKLKPLFSFISYSQNWCNKHELYMVGGKEMFFNLGSLATKKKKMKITWGPF